MSIIKKLKGQETQPAPVVNPNACQKRNCEGVYVPRRIGIVDEKGKRSEICVRLVCSKCGHTKQKRDNTGLKETMVYAYGPYGATDNVLDFNVPRSCVEEAVFDRAGVPVLGAGGEQVRQYRPELKKEFVRKLLSLVDYESRCEQYFTLAEVKTAK